MAGFGRTLVFSHSVGAGCVGQAYATANTLPNVLFEVAAGGALAGAIVPLLAGPLERGRGEEVDRTASALLTWTLMVLVPLGLALAALADPLAGALVGSGSCPGERDLAAAMIVVFAPQVPLYGIGTVLVGVLQAHHRFGWPALAPLLSSIVVIIAYLGYAASLPQVSLAWLAGGTTAGVAVLTLPLLVPAVRAGVRLRPTFRFPPGVARRAVRLAAAGLAALLAQQVFVVATLVLANTRGQDDTLNAFQYGQAVYLLPYAVLAVPLATAAFPRLAARAGTGDLAGFTRLAGRSTRAVSVVGLLGAALVAGTAPAVDAFFRAIDRVGVSALDGALLALAPGLLGYALVAHLGRALYALERGRAAATATAAGWLVAAAAASALVVAGGGGARTVVALGAGLSVGMLVGGAGLLVALRRAAGPGALAGVARTFAVGVAGAASAAWIGRRAAQAVLDGTGGTPVGAGVAAVVAASVVSGVVAAFTLVGDRGALSGLRRDAADSRDATDAVDSGGELAPRTVPRVLLVLGTSSGGVGRHVAALARGLVADGRPVTVAGPAGALAAFDLPGTGAALAAVEVSDRPRPARDARAIVRLRHLAAGHDVVHAHGLRAGALAVLATLPNGRPPVLVTLHNALVGGGRTAVVHRVLERVVARGAVLVLGVSGDLVTRMGALGARTAGRAIVPAPSRPGSGATAAEVRAALGVPGDVALAVTVARLAPQKGLEALLDAAGAVTRTVAAQRVRWVVAGDGPLHGALSERIAGEGLPVTLLGRRDDVPDLLAAADVAVVPSVWEGQPLVVQEALRAGAAVVATDVGGTAEVTGSAAVLVPPDDPGALAAAVTALLADPDRAAALRTAALTRAGTLPTDGDAVRQVEALYDRLAARRAADERSAGGPGRTS